MMFSISFKNSTYNSACCRVVQFFHSSKYSIERPHSPVFTNIISFTLLLVYLGQSAFFFFELIKHIHYASEQQKEKIKIKNKKYR